jgi:hypothetical protein
LGFMGSRARLAAKPLGIALALVAALACASGPAFAERAQYGNLIVSLRGGIVPIELPRRNPAPVTVHLAGGVQTSDSAPLPRVNSIKLEIAWRGELNTEGLPVCPKLRLLSTDSSQALEVCGPALVGNGRLAARIFIPSQKPFGIRAHLLAFNGKTENGRRAVWVQGYSNNPPVSFVLPFTVSRQEGSFKTVLTSVIGKAVGPWPRVSNFQIKISRDFIHNGERQSYLNATCPVPPGFTAGFLSLARATYKFDDGEELTTESVRSCRAR